MFMIIVSLIVLDVLCILGARKANSILHQVQKYNFENRTSGGVVTFATYEDSIKLNKKKARGAALMFISLVGLAFFTICIFIAFMAYDMHNHH